MVKAPAHHSYRRKTFIAFLKSTGS